MNVLETVLWWMCRKMTKIEVGGTGAESASESVNIQLPKFFDQYHLEQAAADFSRAQSDRRIGKRALWKDEIDSMNLQKWDKDKVERNIRDLIVAEHSCFIEIAEDYVTYETNTVQFEEDGHPVLVLRDITFKTIYNYVNEEIDK